jgi:hypothetical protein
MASNFPEFDSAYDTVLLPDDADRFNHIAAATRFNIYNSPIWRVQGRKYSEAIIQACVDNLFLHGYDDAAHQLIKEFEIKQ